MNELRVVERNGKIVVSSIDVADSFGKEHKHVLESIKKLRVENSTIDNMFFDSFYISELNGREYKTIEMNRDGFTLLAMGFTGKKALEWKLKYIEAFNKMEEELKKSQQNNLPNDYISALKELIKKEEEKEMLELENKEMKPKALFADSVSASKTSILIGQLAKLIKQNGKEIGQNRLFKWMRDNGYLCKSGENYNMPTQYSMNLELMEVKENSIVNADGSVRITRTTKITGKGQQYFVNKLLVNN